MRFDAPIEDQWLGVNLAAQEILQIQQPRVSVRCFQGAEHGVYELLLGLMESFPHRKKVGIVELGTPWFQSSEKKLMRERYQLEKKTDREDLSVWADSLDEETLAVFVCEDHAITAELYHNSEWVASLLAKKIFVIRLSHFKHRSQRFQNWAREEIHPFEIRMLSLTGSLSLAVLGARCRFNPLVSPFLDWRGSAEKIQKSLTISHEDKDLVESVEVTTGDYVPLKINGDRVWDRALLCINDESGDWLIHELAEELQISLASPSEVGLLEASHLCRWQAHQFWNWSGLSEKQQSRLVALSTSALKKAEFRGHLAAVFARNSR